MSTVGFPRMHKEAGERRDFLPDLVRTVANAGVDVVIESGLGSGMGLLDADYAGPGVRVGTNLEAFGQDVVIVLRSPETTEFTKLRNGATLVSMLHYPTRPARVAALGELGTEALALDQIVDDAGQRLVVNARAVGWNGVDVAFQELDRTWPSFRSRDRGPIQVTVTGVGEVGRYAVEAATKFGDVERRDALTALDVPGVVVRAVGRNVTRDERLMRSLLSDSDVFVDASQRDDASRPLIQNHWIGDLPRHAVICDLVVDPYLLDTSPPTVRSIEGIPKGDLDKLVFHPEDADWCDTIPDSVPSEHRRTVVSCYSWPGVRPFECMELYGKQLAPLVETLLARGGPAGLRRDGDYHERALRRALLRTWIRRNPEPRHAGRGGLRVTDPTGPLSPVLLPSP